MGAVRKMHDAWAVLLAVGPFALVYLAIGVVELAMAVLPVIGPLALEVAAIRVIIGTVTVAIAVQEFAAIPVTIVFGVLAENIFAHSSPTAINVISSIAGPSFYEDGSASARRFTVY